MWEGVAARTEAGCATRLTPPARRRVSSARSSGIASSSDGHGRRVRSWDLTVSNSGRSRERNS
uniref:Uncharacterized protein n=1 Tax=Arundo donax TaxID=35708 RepID=A0A0A9H9T0_ARUDO